MTNFGPRDGVPERYAQRRLYEHNADITQCEPETQDIFSSYDKFEEVMESLYQDPDEKGTAERELARLEQKGAAVTYTAEF